MSSYEAPRPEVTDGFDDVIYVDPVQLAQSAITELILSANSGCFDNSKISELREKMSIIKNGDDEYLVIRIPRASS